LEVRLNNEKEVIYVGTAHYTCERYHHHWLYGTRARTSARTSACARTSTSAGTCPSTRTGSSACARTSARARTGMGSYKDRNLDYY